MTHIIAVAGKKQSGKNTSANHLHGRVLKNLGSISDFALSTTGELQIETVNAEGVKGWGHLDINRKDDQFVNYAEANIWPYVKVYGFADALKQLCVELFDIPSINVWGTDDDKNVVMPHLLWENMPGITPRKSRGKAKSPYPTSGPMTARQFLQYFGTEVMRKMYGDIWANYLVKQIAREGSDLAIIADMRFPNEVESVLKVGGTVVRLTRDIFHDQHESEVALDPQNFDQSKFTYVVDNDGPDYSIGDLCTDLDKIYREITQK